MTEIEKMFENAGISICKREQGFTLKDCADRECKECGYYDLLFTAEKQIELIKWLSKRPLSLLIGRYKGKYYFGNSNFNSKADSFDNAIAIRINDLWQDLTDQEKKEIRNILNENN